jgi:hypothetical protein
MRNIRATFTLSDIEKKRLMLLDEKTNRAFGQSKLLGLLITKYGAKLVNSLNNATNEK